MDTVDVRGLGCPLPQMKTRNALRKLPKGTQIKVICSGKDALADIRALIRGGKHAIVSEEFAGDVTTFVIEAQGSKP